jgi:glycosyltransferase involved in cell wall biosynthesis
MNSEKTIARTFESLLRQTVKPEKIIVVYDNSQDNTLSIINEYLKKFPDLISFIQGPGVSAGAARQEGIAAAQTRYIAFLDADDWYADDALEHLLSSVEKTGAVCGFICKVYADGTRKQPSKSNEREITFDMLKRSNPVPMSTTMYRRELLKEVRGFDLNLRTVEDYDLHLRITKVTKYSLVNRVIAYYNVHEDPTQSWRTRGYAKWIAIIWLKHGFVDYRSIWHAITYSVTSILLVPINMIKKIFRPKTRIFHYEYLQILAGYISGLARGHQYRTK